MIEETPLCASSNSLYEFYISNHKEKNINELNVEYEENKVNFFRKILEHFIEYNYPNKNCLIVFDASPLIKSYKNPKFSWLFNEYCINLDGIIKKNKKEFKVLIIPFFQEDDLTSFHYEASKIFNLKYNIWSEKKMSYDCN